MLIELWAVSIEDSFGDFEHLVSGLIKDEQKILEEQRREAQEMRSLKSMVEDLSAKLVTLGREYAMEMEKKDQKILDLQERRRAAYFKESEKLSEQIEKANRRLDEYKAKIERRKEKQYQRYQDKYLK